MANEKVKKYLLDDELIREIEGKAPIGNTRLKDESITLDDLAPEVRNKIQSWGAPAGSSYDDTGIRNRILNIENDHISKNDAFNKTTDKVSINLLDNDLTDCVNKITNNENRIKAIEDNYPNKDDVRYKNVPIERTDLSKNLSDIINVCYSYYQSIVPSGNNTLTATDIATISAAINTLMTSKADKNEVAKCRKLDIPITINDFNSQLQGVINNAQNVINNFDNKVESTELTKYRLKKDLIDENDLSVTVSQKIDKGYNFANNVDDSIRMAVSTEGSNIRAEVQTADLGNRYDQVPFPMVIQRQILASAFSGFTDSYTFADMVYWLYSRTIGNVYSLNDALQSEICKFNNIPQESDSNKSYYGVAYGRFGVLEYIKYLHNLITALQSNNVLNTQNIDSIKTSIAGINGDISSLQNSINSITTDITAIKQDILNLQNANNSSSPTV